MKTVVGLEGKIRGLKRTIAVRLSNGEPTDRQEKILARLERSLARKTNVRQAG